MTNLTYTTGAKQTLLFLGLLIGAVILYLYYLNVSVVQVVIRKELLQTETQLEAEIAVLVTEYINAKHDISARIVTLEGYNVDPIKTFITPDDTSLVLGAN